MTEAGWTSNDHAINLYTYVLGYHPDQEALEAGDDKDYNAIKRALEHSYQQGRVAGLRDAEVLAQFMVMATPSNVAAALRFMADKLEAQEAQEAQ